MLDCLGEPANRLVKIDENFRSEIVSFSSYVGMLNFNKLEDDIAGRSNEPFIAHISIPQIFIACSSRLDLQCKLLDSWNNLGLPTKMTLSSYDFSLAPTSWTSLRE